VSRCAAKEAKVVVEMALMFLRCQLTVFAEFWKNIRSGLLFGSAALALGRARVVVVLLGL